MTDLNLNFDSGSFSPWAGGVTSIGAIVSSSPTPRFGPYCAKVSSTGSVTMYTPTFPIDPTGKIILTGWFYGVDYSGSLNPQSAFRLVFLDANGTIIGFGYPNTDVPGATRVPGHFDPPLGIWAQYGGAYVGNTFVNGDVSGIPANAHFAYIEVYPLYKAGAPWGAPNVVAVDGFNVSQPDVPLVIPAEGTYSDIELDLIDNEPPGLFPGDQNSYWGQVRKVYGDYLQLNFADRYAQWYLNLDPRTVHHDDLPEWEEMLGIPLYPHDYVGPITDDYRRSFIEARRAQGPFTHERRAKIIESFIGTTYGEPASFGVDGLVLDGAGIPLYAGTMPPSSSYRVYDDVNLHTYAVYIVNTITPDLAGMERELKRITPAGITFTINNSVTNVLDYGLAARNTQPVANYRLAGNASDSSGYANHGTLNGAPASVTPPGLLHALSTGGGCYDFDGVDDNMVIPAAPQNSLAGPYSLSAWINLDAQAAAGHYRPILSNNGSTVYIALAAGGLLFTSSWLDGVQKTVGGFVLGTGTTYFVVARYTGKALELFVNGAKVGSAAFTGLATTSSHWIIGAAFGDWFDGKIDEVKIHNYALSQKQITELYNQGIGVA